VVKKIPDIVHEGIYEYEIAAEMNYLMEKYGATKPAFDTIASFGKNTAEPHYTHGDYKLKSGDFLLFDFGANYRKYNSDITRTFVFNKSNQKQRKIYQTVFDAQKIGLDKIKPGVKANYIHEEVSSYIDKTEFKGCFIHSTGHSLGLAVHDGLGFSPEADFELKENMVFTVEPGIYLPGFGGVRIEDDILIKRNGYELLTKSSKDFLEI
jgi:Xaa-Pro dipeptidase